MILEKIILILILLGIQYGPYLVWKSALHLSAVADLSDTPEDEKEASDAIMAAIFITVLDFAASWFFVTTFLNLDKQ